MSDCDKCGTKTLEGYCPQCEWNDNRGDEFLIVASGHPCLNPNRKWTRACLDTSKFIAHSAVMGLNYGKATVYNIYGGHPSNPLYVCDESGGHDMPES